MYINQISVFIENKPGNLAALTTFLANNGIDLRALEVADSRDFGIIRFIVDNPLETLTLLKDNDWVCKMTQVIGVQVPDAPGSMAKVMEVLAEHRVSIDYIYAFIARDVNNALMIFRVADNDKVAAILKENNFKIIEQEDIEKM